MAREPTQNEVVAQHTSACVFYAKDTRLVSVTGRVSARHAPDVVTGLPKTENGVLRCIRSRHHLKPRTSPKAHEQPSRASDFPALHKSVPHGLRCCRITRGPLSTRGALRFHRSCTAMDALTLTRGGPAGPSCLSAEFKAKGRCRGKGVVASSAGHHITRRCLAPRPRRVALRAVAAVTAPTVNTDVRGPDCVPSLPACHGAACCCGSSDVDALPCPCAPAERPCR